jgi:hypothetical protein
LVKCGRIGYIRVRTGLLGLTKMAWQTVADHDQKHSAPTWLALALLIGGLSLVSAGALLWSRHGGAVFFDNPVLAALAWCF